jgi:hypothetical protein
LYKKPHQTLALLAAVFIENFGYRQLVSWRRLMGLVRWLRKQSGHWGEMKRTASWQRSG